MGHLGQVLSFVRVLARSVWSTDVKLDPGGGALKTGTHFGPAGDDAHPLPGDTLIAIQTPRAGRADVVGYVDTVNPPKAEAGEKRVYARDASGAVVVEVWLKNTGEATIVNSSGYLTLQPSGQILANGARITTGGDVITAGGVSLDNHFHQQAADGAGDSQQDTTAPTATE